MHAWERGKRSGAPRGATAPQSTPHTRSGHPAAGQPFGLGVRVVGGVGWGARGGGGLVDRSIRESRASAVRPRTRSERNPDRSTRSNSTAAPWPRSFGGLPLHFLPLGGCVFAFFLVRMDRRLASFPQLKPQQEKPTSSRSTAAAPPFPRCDGVPPTRSCEYGPVGAFPAPGLPLHDREAR